MDTLLTPILSGLSALLAAWLGTHLGLRKFRQERAFVAQQEWYRNFATTTRVLRNRARALNAFERSGTPPEVAGPLVKDLGKLAFEFQEQAELSHLYARRRTHTAIQSVLEQMAKTAQPFGKELGPDDSAGPTEEQGRELWSASMAGLNEIYRLLARDLRRMHGLDEIKELDKRVSRQ